MASAKIQIERILKEKNMTIEQLADELGVSRMTLWRWKQGKAKPSRLALRSLDATMTTMDLERWKK